MPERPDVLKAVALHFEDALDVGTRAAGAPLARLGEDRRHVREALHLHELGAATSITDAPHGLLQSDQSPTWYMH